jgi:hypothetical protein
VLVNMRFRSRLFFWFIVVLGLIVEARADGLEGGDRVSVGSGGVGVQVPGLWGVLRVSYTNSQDRPKEFLAVSYFDDDPQLQFGRRLTVPPRSRRISWHPIRMPSGPDEMIDFHTLLLTRENGVETLMRQDTGRLKLENSVIVSSLEVATGIIDQSAYAPPGENPGGTGTDLLLTARYDRNVRNNAVHMIEWPIPVGDEYIDVLDQLVVADDRVLSDAAGLQAIRRWMTAGGRVWVMLDRTSTSVIDGLLGQEATVSEVDRVGLTLLTVEPGPSSPPIKPAPQDHEVPVPFVRVYAEGFETAYSVNGWPAALWKEVGQGRLLVTTLGPAGWMRPRLPKDPPAPGGTGWQTQFVPGPGLSWLSQQFYLPRTRTLLPEEAAEAVIRQQIGYAIPSQRLVGGWLLAGVGLIGVASIVLLRKERLEWIGLAAPCIAIVVAGVVFWIGQRNRAEIPSGTTTIELVQAVPGGRDVRIEGLSGILAKDAAPLKVSGTDGGAILPKMDGLASVTRRMVWTDIDHWGWENLPAAPGLRIAKFEGSSSSPVTIEAPASCDGEGVTGKLSLPSGIKASDAVLVTPRGRIAVTLQEDGAFKAPSTAVLSGEAYLGAGILDDRQQQRNRLLATMLSSGSKVRFPTQPTLLVWTPSWDARLSLGEGTQTGEALVAVPIRWEKPSEGAAVTIPSPLVHYREVTGPQGESTVGLYDRRTEQWTERARPISAWLGLDLPRALQPLKLESATIRAKVVGPIGRLEILGLRDGQTVSLQTWENPAGSLEATIGDAESLKFDSQGRLLLKVAAGVEVEQAELSNDPANYWRIESFEVELRGRAAAAH